ncbi:MAG: cation transporter [Clostridia bacterium]|nr:cation transporter [Clostridia bacterium]
MNRSKEIIRVSIIGILTNIVLVAFKAVVGFISGSIAIILDAVNNLSDALSSIITIVGVKLSAKAPDKKHPYGHGRIENISSVTVAVIVLLAGLTAFKESFDKILHPEAADYTAASLIIIAVAVAAKFFLGRYVKKKGTILHSDSLIASGSDASFDAAVTFSTLVAAGVSILWHLNIEGYLGIIISVVIIKSGIEILLNSLNEIIGIRADSELTSGLKEKINSYDRVLGTYDLILHKYGPEKTIGSAHIEVDDCLTAKEIDSLTRKITQDIFLSYGIILTLGIYAANTDSSETAKIKQAITDIIEKYPEILQMHGFYADTENYLISFDLVMDFNCDAAVTRNKVLNEISEKYPLWHFNIILDSDFSD